MIQIFNETEINIVYNIMYLKFHIIIVMNKMLAINIIFKTVTKKMF